MTSRSKKKGMSNPVRLIVIAFFLEVVGFTLPFLMVIKVITPTFLLSFIAFGASVSGVFLGFYGASLYTFRRRQLNDYLRKWNGEDTE